MPIFARLVIFAVAPLLIAFPAYAQSDHFNRPSWGTSDQPSRNGFSEGHVDVEHFQADGAETQLGHGAIAVVSGPGGNLTARDNAIFEAAVVDQLAKAGYDVVKPDPTGGQIAELRVIRDVLVPEERKRNPVSGEMSVGVGSHGSGMGLGIAIDLTKPKKALLSTRLEARIRDRASGAVLWEGHASIATRDESSRWNDDAIAARLAAALFADFHPKPSPSKQVP
ncbi:MAG: hypothetical protein RLY97_979 [Pseudomonadota bacterium]